MSKTRLLAVRSHITKHTETEPAKLITFITSYNLEKFCITIFVKLRQLMILEEDLVQLSEIEDLES